MLPIGPKTVRTKSWRHSAISMPSAEKLPGSLGMITCGIAISRAIATAWSGPAPPKAMSTVSRGSMPRLTETARTRATSRASAMLAMPSAASTMPSPVGLADLLLHRGLGEALVEAHAAAQEPRAVEPAEDEIGVGDGRIRRRRGHSRRAGIGAGAARADLEPAARVAPSDRAAAGPDLDDVDDRQLHRLAGDASPMV